MLFVVCKCKKNASEKKEIWIIYTQTTMCWLRLQYSVRSINLMLNDFLCFFLPHQICVGCKWWWTWERLWMWTFLSEFYMQIWNYQSALDLYSIECFSNSSVLCINSRDRYKREKSQKSVQTLHVYSIFHKLFYCVLQRKNCEVFDVLETAFLYCVFNSNKANDDNDESNSSLLSLTKRHCY